MNRLLPVSGFCQIITALACLAQGPISWEQRAPLGSAFIKEIAGKTWVGGITNMTSVDGKVWNASPPIMGMPFFDIIEAGGRIVAVGDSGRVAVSPDGTTWTKVQTPSRALLKGIAYGTGLYVAVGYQGTILTSADGSGWDTLPRQATTSLMDIVFGGGLFAAVGQEGEVWTSPDGKAWTIIKDNFRKKTLNSIAWGKDGFLAVGNWDEYHYSADGVKWSSADRASNDDFTSVAFGDSLYLVGGNLGNLFSVRGNSWTKEEGIDLCGYSQIGYIKDHFLLRACEGSLETWNRQGLKTFPYGGSEQDLSSVAWNSSGFAAVGRTSLLFSADGFTWMGGAPIDRHASVDIRGVCAGRDLSFRAVGGNTNGYAKAYYFSKEPGSRWSYGENGSNTGLKATAFGNDTYVDLGSLAQFDSPSADYMQIGGLVFSEGRFFAVGAYAGQPKPGAVAWSSDGVAWTSIKGVATQMLQSAAYGAGRFVAVGDSGTIAVSPDGVGWIQLASPTRSQLRAVAYGGGCFLAIGNGLSTIAGGMFLVSANGLDWEAIPDPIANGLKALVYGRDGFAAVGVSGRIIFVHVDLSAVSARASLACNFGGIQVRRTWDGLSVSRPGSPYLGPVMADLLSPTGRWIRGWELQPRGGILQVPIRGLSQSPALLRLRDPKNTLAPATVRILPGIYSR